jgi:hypothetical protein
MTTNQGFRKLLHSVQEVLTADRSRQEAYAKGDKNLRQSLPSTRRIDLLSISGGSGCSFLSARLAVLLAHRRGGRVLGVDAGHQGVFSSLVGARDHNSNEITSEWRPPAQMIRRLHPPISLSHLDEVGCGLKVGAKNLRVLRPTSPLTLVRPQDWATAVTPLASRFDVTITDWGHRRVGDDFEHAVSESNFTALVCRADRFAIEATLSVAEVVSSCVSCLVCAVDVDAVGPKGAQIAQNWSPVPLYFVPFEAVPTPPMPSPSMRRSLIDIGAHLMGDLR